MDLSSVVQNLFKEEHQWRSRAVVDILLPIGTGIALGTFMDKEEYLLYVPALASASYEFLKGIATYKITGRNYFKKFQSFVENGLDILVYSFSGAVVSSGVNVTTATIAVNL